MVSFITGMVRKWTANNEDGFTEVFVNVDGDNMTGDLTLGTDKITLDADLGEADFAGYVQINSSPTTTNPGLIVSCQQNTPDLGGWIRLADETTGVARSQWGYNLGVNDVTLDLVGSGTGLRIRNSNANLDSATDLINVDADGSATFAGVTRIGDPDNADPTSAAATGVRISNNGLVKIKNLREAVLFLLLMRTMQRMYLSAQMATASLLVT